MEPAVLALLLPTHQPGHLGGTAGTHGQLPDAGCVGRLQARGWGWGLDASAVRRLPALREQKATTAHSQQLQGSWRDGSEGRHLSEDISLKIGV